MDINWFPGHMAKALRTINEHMPLVDVIVETCDARIPRSSRNPELGKMIADKPSFLLLNKMDLADPIETDKWIQYLNKEEHIRAIACDTKSSVGINLVRNTAFQLGAEILKKSEEKGRQNRPLRLMIVGIPNTGKSTLINAICARKAANTSNRPGVTRGPQWVRSKDQKIELLDMPGVLWPKLETDEQKLSLAATGAIRDQVLPMEEVAYLLFIRLMKLYPEALKSRFKLQDLEGNPYDLFLLAARKRGAILSGGRIDEARFAELFLNEFRSADISRITLELVDQSPEDETMDFPLDDEGEDLIIGSY